LETLVVDCTHRKRLHNYEHVGLGRGMSQGRPSEKRQLWMQEHVNVFIKANETMYPILHIQTNPDDPLLTL